MSVVPVESVARLVARKLRSAIAPALPRLPALAEEMECRRLFAGATFDPQWSGDGVASLPFESSINAIAPLPEGKLIVVGSARIGRTGPTPDQGGELDLLVARYNANGTLDRTFGGGDGWIAVDLRDDDVANAVAIAPDGKIVVGGYTLDPSSSPSNADFLVMRFTASGALDTTFSGDGIATLTNAVSGSGTFYDSVRDLVITPNNRVVVVGESANNVAGQRRTSLMIARYLDNGQLDHGFGGNNNGYNVLRVGDGTNTTANAILQRADGRLIVGGSARTLRAPFNPSDDLALFRFSSSGKLDTTFGAGGYTLTNIGYDSNDETGETVTTGYSDDAIHDLVFDTNGDVLAVGQSAYVAWFFDPFVDQVLVRYRPDGQVFTFATDTVSTTTDFPNLARATSIALHEGKVITAGESENANLYVARYDAADFSRDTTFNPAPLSDQGTNFVRYFTDVFAPVHVSLAIGREGKIHAGGITVGNNQYVGLTLRLEGQYVDVDDTLAEAPFVRLGVPNASTIAGRLFVGSDVNLIRFSVDTNQRVNFDLDRAGDSGLDSYLRLFDRSGNQIASNDDGLAPGEAGTTKDSFLQYVFPRAGIYYLGVSTKSNTGYNVHTGAGDRSGSWGGYFLTTHVAPSDADDRITTATKQVPLNGTIFAGIGSPTDVDIYEVVVSAGQRLGIDVDANGSPLDGYLRVFDAAANQLLANDNGIAPGETFALMPYAAITFATAGKYYIAISGRGNDAYNPLTSLNDKGGSMGAYSLVLSVIG